MDIIVQDILIWLGVWGLLALMVCNGAFSFPPSELILSVAGVIAFNFQKPLLLALLCAVIGNVIGAIILYSCGKLLSQKLIVSGHDWLSNLYRPFNSLSIVLPSQEMMLAYAEKIDKQDDIWVLYSRCVPLIRSVVSLPAAILGVRVPRFILLTTIGCLIWCTIWLAGGYFLGTILVRFGVYISILIAGALACAFVCLRLYKH